MSTAIQEPSTAPAACPPIRDYMSFSSLNTFRQCSLKYYFKYVLGLPEATVSSALVYGSGVHRAIEHHFRELLAGNQPPDLDTLLAEFWEEWRDRTQEEIRFGKDEDLNSIGRLAERTLVAFKQSEVAQPRGQILAVEEELRGPVVPGCPDLLGRVDMIVNAGNSLVVTDWKTARTRWSQEQVEDSSEQLLLYAELAKDFAPGKPTNLEFIVLTKTKDVAVDRHSLPVAPASVTRVKRVVEQVWRAIKAEAFFPSPSAMNCPGCPFRGQCREW